MQYSIGEFLKCFSSNFSDYFPQFLPLILSVLKTREEKFSSPLMDAIILSILQIENWPMDSEFYECLNLLATKLNEFEDLKEANLKFHERLTRFVSRKIC